MVLPRAYACAVLRKHMLLCMCGTEEAYAPTRSLRSIFASTECHTLFLPTLEGPAQGLRLCSRVSACAACSGLRARAATQIQHNMAAPFRLCRP
eukprot:3115134-Rhodomonas_salina.1